MEFLSLIGSGVINDEQRGIKLDRDSIRTGGEGSNRPVLTSSTADDP